MALETAAAREGLPTETEAYRFGRVEDQAIQRLDPGPMWSMLAQDLVDGRSAGTIAARFHLGLALALVDFVEALGRTHPFDSVALSGGCFQNRILLEQVSGRLELRGYHCLSNLRTPANDGGVALGQAVVAAAQHLAGEQQ